MLRIMLASALMLVINLPASAQIRISEIGSGVMFDGAMKWVELHNTGDSEFDATGLILCDFPQYPTVHGLPALGGGNIVIPADGYLVVAWSLLDSDDDGDAEVGLYEPGTFDFNDDTKVLDYMQYGEAAHAREGAAVTAGVWSAGEFVEAAAAGMTLQLVDDAATGASNWIAAEPTPNEANAGGSAASQVRISEIGINVMFDGAMEWVELHNTGDTEIDVADLVLCDFPAYPAVSSLAVLDGGSTTIPADGYVVLAWPGLDPDDSGSSEVGLYVAGTSDFGDAGNILDYMEFGAAGQFREGTAVEAGVWAAGEFVANAGAGLSLQLIDDSVVGSASWVAATPTPNAMNSVATSIEEGETPNGFALYSNFPNPFNPTTTITYDLSRAGQVSLDVYDMLGQKITSLFDGGQPAGSYSYAWDGRDARGNVVSSGVYFYRLTLDGRISESRVMTLLK